MVHDVVRAALLRQEQRSTTVISSNDATPITRVDRQCPAHLAGETENLFTDRITFCFPAFPFVKNTFKRNSKYVYFYTDPRCCGETPYTDRFELITSSSGVCLNAADCLSVLIVD